VLYNHPFCGRTINERYRSPPVDANLRGLERRDLGIELGDDVAIVDPILFQRILVDVRRALTAACRRGRRWPHERGINELQRARLNLVAFAVPASKHVIFEDVALQSGLAV